MKGSRIFVSAVLVLGIFVGPLFGWTICVDPGHGGSDPGATGTYYTEKEANLDVALKVKWYLQRISSITQIGMTRESDVDVSLEERVNYANSNGFNRFMSIHHNAYNGTVQGTETYCYTSGSANSFAWRDSTHPELVKAFGYTDRGASTANYYVLRYTNMPAILGEVSFIDYNVNFNESWRFKYDWYGHVEREAHAYVRGLCKHLGLSIPSFVLHTQYPDSVYANTNFTVRDSFYVPSFQAPVDVVFEVKTVNGGNVIHQQRINNIGAGTWIRTWGQTSSILLPDSGRDYYVYFVTYVVPAGGNWNNRYDHISTRLLPTKVKSSGSPPPSDTSCYIVYVSYPTVVYAESNIVVVDSFYIAPNHAPADLIFEIKHRQSGNVLYSERVSNLGAGYWRKTFGLNPPITLPDSGYDYQVYFLSVLAPPGGGWSNRYAYASTYSNPTTVRTNPVQDTSYILCINYPVEVYAESNIVVIDSFYIAQSQSPADLVFEIRHWQSSNTLYTERVSNLGSGYGRKVFGVDPVITLPDSGYDYRVYFVSYLTPPGGGWNSRYVSVSTYSNPTTIRTNPVQDTSYIVYLSYPVEVYAESNTVVIDSFYISPAQAPADLIFEIKHRQSGNVLYHERLYNIGPGYWRKTFGLNPPITLPDSGYDYQVYFLSVLTPPGGGWSNRYTYASTYLNPTTVHSNPTALREESKVVFLFHKPIYVRDRVSFHYSAPGRKGLNIILYDIAGRVLLEIPLPNDRGRVDCYVDLPSGVYYYVLTAEGKHLLKERLIVVK